MLLSAVTNDFGSYRVSMADYRARRARPDPPTCQGAEPDLHLLKQVERVTALVVEGPAGQDSEHGVAVLVFIQQLWVWLLFRCRNSEEGPRASVYEGRSGNAIGPTRRFHDRAPWAAEPLLCQIR